MKSSHREADGGKNSLKPLFKGWGKDYQRCSLLFKGGELRKQRPMVRLQKCVLTQSRVRRKGRKPNEI